MQVPPSMLQWLWNQKEQATDFRHTKRTDSVLTTFAYKNESLAYRWTYKA